jgi:NAD(P)-dependent dehydrogenase (short-subunit alcohol dehydrogenase family)
MKERRCEGSHPLTQVVLILNPNESTKGKIMSKTILITGTSNGFGKDAALTLATAGHQVFATMRGVNDRNRSAAEELRLQGIGVLELDVTSDASVNAAFKELHEKIGSKLDVLINNAGLFAQGISETFTPQQVGAMFDVNVIGIQRVTRAALPAMRKNKSGLIINIGSILGRVTIPFIGLYGASKFAVDAMTESYRYELSQLGIDVVLAQPSAYPTKLYSSLQHAADSSRALGYGQVAAVPDEFVKFLSGVFGGDNPPDSHDVARALVDLIETPAGKRQERVIVGAPFGADAVNAAAKPVQAELVKGLGMDSLSRLKVG